MSKKKDKKNSAGKNAADQTNQQHTAAGNTGDATNTSVTPEEVTAPVVRTRGIVLIALGNPEYGRMAWNLLVTIRAADKDTPVAIVHNHTSLSHLSASQQAMFDKLIVCPVELYTHEGKPAYVKPKVFLYNITPYDDTLFMDSDVAMMPGRKVSDLMNELSDIDFTIKNTGRYNIAENRHDGNQTYGYGGWETQKLPELAKMYGIHDGYFYQVQGEVFWFRKCLRVRALFDVAQRAFTEQKAFIVGGFAGQNMNDELAFIIAIAYVGIDPHMMPWTPTYWYLLEATGKNPNRSVVMGSHWMLSIGGNNVPAVIEKFYNDIVGRASLEMRQPHNFKLKRKSTYLPERKIF